MSTSYRSQIIHSEPIGDALIPFRRLFSASNESVSAPQDINPHTQGNALDDSLTFTIVHNISGLKDVATFLISVLSNLPAARSLPSVTGRGTLRNDLLQLLSTEPEGSELERVVPLIRAVIHDESDEIIWNKVYAALAESTPPSRPAPSIQQTPWLRSTGCFVNSTEHRKYVDDVLKEELGQIYVGIPGFFEAFFGEVVGLNLAAQAVFDKCKQGDNPLYREESGWRGWPEDAKERDVLAWFAPLTEQLLDFAVEHQPGSKSQRRPLAQPHQPLQGSTADRKLDIGFVEDSDAGMDSKYRWSQILVPGELKCNPLADKASGTWLDLGRYAREVLAAQDTRRFVLGFTLCGSLMRLWEFDRLGAVASEQFDINQDGLQFVSVMLGFLWMNEEHLGFDPTIIKLGDKRCIEIERDNNKVRLVIDELIKRVRCVAGRATTCWRVHQEDDPGKQLVVKDSWQYAEREEEGELLREATEKGVRNVARYFHHEVVHVGGQEDDIRVNVRKGLDMTKATNYRPEKSLTPPSNTIGHQVSGKDESSSVDGRKRSSNCTGMRLPPSKRIRSSSSKTPVIVNRVHRRVIVHDFGHPIYKASSRISLLAAFEQCIEGYESLHTRAGMLQRDISPNNLMINEDDANPSWRAFLIDLDLAIKEQREKSSGARGKTGTRAFMAIGVLYDDQPHSFMHDLESFFWVLFWICIHYSESQGRVVKDFEEWNYARTEDLAKLKLGTVSDDRIFRSTAVKHFTEYYQPLIPCVDRLRRKVFPGGRRWRDPNQKLYAEMKEIFRAAQAELMRLEE
ncbi:hypothetical protein ED733_006610 [Metarhizium rileyi]|uniref:Fungal-type protein kinase domain-containing protein n=1 Tax=Metarhizium rileyi (strain RCEF 4871) TaxID=1649241 RepID=A0A5C6GC31_METRR|nr:hypothetical protein ED733_006610 [Metarhizium rileyi]